MESICLLIAIANPKIRPARVAPQDRAGRRGETIARSGLWKHVLVTFGAVVVLGALVAAGGVFSGLFNVAATVIDSPPLT